MKNLLVLILVGLLSGCVSYYQPEYALEDGVYYAEDDPSYAYNADDYSGVVYYPWSSLDYFYLGYWPYSGYGFAYDYPFGYGYLAWGYPYAYNGFFPPWYFPYYYNDPSWTSYHRVCHHHGRCRGNDDDRDTGTGSYAGDGHQNQTYPGGAGEENAFYSHNGKDKMGHTGYPPTKRYVVKTPAGRSGNQDTVTRSGKPVKTSKYMAQPGYPLSPGSKPPKPMAAGSAPRPPSAPSMYTNSGHQTRSPTSGSQAHSSSPVIHKSAGRKDRD